MKSIIFCLVLLLSCFFENQSFGMNQANKSITQKAQRIRETNKKNSVFCNSCRKAFANEGNYDRHMLRVHAFCIWCKSYPIGEHGSEWYKFTSELQRKFLYNHLIECAISSEGILYVCDICFGFSNDSRRIHFHEKCNGFNKAVIMGKSSMQYNIYQQKIKKNDLPAKCPSKVQSNYKSFQNISKKLDSSKLVMTNQDGILEEFLDSIHNDSVEQQCHYLGDCDLTYNSILSTSVCGSVPSRICTQSCDVTSS